MGLFSGRKSIDRQWWLREGKELHESVMDNYRLLKDQEGNDPRRYLAFLSLYENRHYKNDGYQAYLNELCRIGEDGYQRSKFNVAKHYTDIVHARVARQQSRARFMSIGGNASIKRRAKLLERWSDAIADTTDLDITAPDIFMDACIFGMGIAKPYRVGQEIRLERVYPGEVYVDCVEAAYDNVRQLFHRKYVSREVLMYQYVNLAKDAGLITAQEANRRKVVIEKARRAEADDDFRGHSLVSDPLECVEAWHLPSGPGATDGKHVIAMDGITLFEEQWDRKDFPLCMVRWSRERRGFYGIGLVEELAGIHVDINNTLNRIEEAISLNASPYVFNNRASQVQKSKVADLPGQWIDYNDTPPQIAAIEAVPREFFSHLQDQLDRAARIARVSSLGGAGGLPAALQTGAAVREAQDADNSDFVMVIEAYQKFRLRIVQEFVRLGREIYEEDNSYTIVAEKDRNTVSRVKWSDVDLDEDSYVLRTMPASALPTTPAGRIDKALEMWNSGLFGREQILSMMNIPDVESELDLATAESDNIDRMIEEILDEGRPQVVEPSDDFQLIMQKANAALKKAKSDGVTEDRLTLLRLFMRQANEKIQEQRAQELQLQAQLVNPAAPPAIDSTGANPNAIPEGTQ